MVKKSDVMGWDTMETHRKLMKIRFQPDFCHFGSFGLNCPIWPKIGQLAKKSKNRVIDQNNIFFCSFAGPGIVIFLSKIRNYLFGRKLPNLIYWESDVKVRFFEIADATISQDMKVKRQKLGWNCGFATSQSLVCVRTSLCVKASVHKSSSA